MLKSGFVNVCKPTGVSSSYVVCAVKKALKLSKVGHLGTLDPAASGVLPIAFGKATKFFDYFLSKDKVYVADVKFGVLTDTLDSFGLIIKTGDKIISDEEIKSVLPKFIGVLKQIPPMYSAIKVGGKKACDIARSGEIVELTPREIEIYDLQLLGKIDDNLYRFRVHCSAGTYIRTLFNDIAEELGTVATTPVIIREKSGAFEIEDSVTLDELKFEPKLLSIEDVFKNFQFFEISDEKIVKQFLNGVKLNSHEVGVDFDEPFFIKTSEKLVGMYHISGGKLVCDVFLYE